MTQNLFVLLTGMVLVCCDLWVAELAFGRERERVCVYVCAAICSKKQEILIMIIHGLREKIFDQCT